MNEIEIIKTFSSLSKKAGERFDLTQAGGGNSSVKIDDRYMLVKASGLSLSQVEIDSGYTKVDYQDVRKIIAASNGNDRNAETEIINKYSSITGERPSIETFLHAYFYKYVIHLHPITVNIFTASNNWDEKLIKLFPESLIVPYSTPGISLARIMDDKLTEYIKVHKKYPKITFLQNHGAVFSSDNSDEIFELINKVNRILAEKIGIHLDNYELCNDISSAYNSIYGRNYICYRSDDIYINKLAATTNIKIFAPDVLVYCGKSSEKTDDYKKLFSKNIQLNLDTKIVHTTSGIYILAKNISKAKETEDVLKFALIVNSYSNNDICPLTEDEQNFLNGWELEKYRRK